MPARTAPTAGEAGAMLRIERRIALAFSGIIITLLLILMAVGTFLYARMIHAEQERLALLVGATLEESVAGVQFAGKYRARMVLEQLVQDNPELVQIEILDTDLQVLAHSDPERNDGPATTAGLQLAELTLGDGEPRLARLHPVGLDIIEVMVPLAGGYGAGRTGVMRVGIRSPPTTTIIAQAALPVGLSLLLVWALSLPAITLISRRLGRPIRALALELSGILEHAPLIIGILDSRGAVMRASGLLRRTTGLDRGDPVRIDEALPGVLEDSASGGAAPVHRESRVVIGGEPRVLLTTHFPVIAGDDPSQHRSCIIATDLTDLHRTSQERDRLAAAVEHADDMVLLVDPTGRIAYTNPAFARLTGYGRDALDAIDPWALIGADPEQAAEQRAAVDQGQPWRGRVDIERPDGSSFACFLSLTRVPGEGGSWLGTVLLGRDVSREQELEDQLRQSQKMEAIGRLAGGIAHDFNNLLTIIGGRAELLTMLAAPDDPKTESLQSIHDAAIRAGRLTRQLLAFSRRQTMRSQDLDLGQVVDELMPMLERVIGEHIDLHFHRGDDGWLMQGDVAQIEQILMNLVVNARDAMPGGGRIRIETANYTLPAGERSEHPGLDPGDYVELAVTDTGAGIPPEIRDKVFDPFFTTKGVGEGTGLGLATVHGIVRQSGGSVELSSRMGEGTSFSILFPRRTADAATSDAPIHELEVPPGGTERVLVVEDEELVRETVTTMLEDAGYTTMEAISGDQALDLLVQLEQPPDLVISDVVMPGMSGPELAVELAARFPGLPVLLMSGYPDVQLENLDNVEVLPKPVGLFDLRRAVRDRLDRG